MQKQSNMALHAKPTKKYRITYTMEVTVIAETVEEAITCFESVERETLLEESQYHSRINIVEIEE